jgi:hypothetical protein
VTIVHASRMRRDFPCSPRFGTPEWGHAVSSDAPAKFKIFAAVGVYASGCISRLQNVAPQPRRLLQQGGQRLARLGWPTRVSRACTP